VETFVLHVWDLPEPAGAPDPSHPSALQGTLEPVGSGVAVPFTSADELLALLRSETARVGREEDAAGSPWPTSPLSWRRG
jgi:hypothetical protein